jgi:hypothetical protein
MGSGGFQDRLVPGQVGRAGQDHGPQQLRLMDHVRFQRAQCLFLEQASKPKAPDGNRHQEKVGQQEPRPDAKQLIQQHPPLPHQSSRAL